MTVINEERNYRELKEIIRIIKGQDDKKWILIKYKRRLSYCLKCKKNTESINSRVSRKTNSKTKILVKRSVCGANKWNFIGEQQAKGLLSNLSIRTPLSKVALLGDILFENYKMNYIINKVLLTGHKIMPEMHLRQPQFTYSAGGPFTNDKQRIQKFMSKEDTNYIYKNELEKDYFAHYAAYSDSNGVAKRTTADKVLRDNVFNIAKDPKYDGYLQRLASMVYKCFGKKPKESGIINEIKENQQLAEEHHKPIIRKFKKEFLQDLSTISAVLIWQM